MFNNFVITNKTIHLLRWNVSWELVHVHKTIKDEKIVDTEIRTTLKQSFFDKTEKDDFKKRLEAEKIVCVVEDLFVSSELEKFDGASFDGTWDDAVNFINGAKMLACKSI